MLGKLIRSRVAARRSSAAIPPGQRFYAIGDIHGCDALLDRLLGEIDADDAARGTAETTLVFLGDLIDRGPHSSVVIERLRALTLARSRIRILAGNHEEIFLRAIRGDEKALRLFCRIGGRETILSYGVAPDAYDRLDYADLAQLLERIVPQAHVEFMDAFEDLIVVGDYAFVHAGVHPAIPLREQQRRDLRWIREPFLDHNRPLEKMIVHGHSISENPEFRRHRIGIDTGAYESGKLTALGLQGTERWTLQTG